MLKPARILDLESTGDGIRHVSGMTVMQSAHIVLIATKAFAQVFMIKTGAKEKAKVKRASCLVKLA